MTLAKSVDSENLDHHRHMSDLVSLYSLVHSHKHKHTVTQTHTHTDYTDTHTHAHTHTHTRTHTHTHTHNFTDKRNYKQVIACLVYNRVIQWRYMTVLVTISSSKNVILV